MQSGRSNNIWEEHIVYTIKKMQDVAMKCLYPPTVLYNATTTHPNTGLQYLLHLSTGLLSSSTEQHPSQGNTKHAAGLSETWKFITISQAPTTGTNFEPDESKSKWYRLCDSKTDRHTQHDGKCRNATLSLTATYANVTRLNTGIKNVQHTVILFLLIYTLTWHFTY